MTETDTECLCNVECRNPGVASDQELGLSTRSPQAAGPFPDILTLQEGWAHIENPIPHLVREMKKESSTTLVAVDSSGLSPGSHNRVCWMGAP